MEKSAEKANASVGYGPNNPEPPSLRESNPPAEKDALHSAAEYIQGEKTTPSQRKEVITITIIKQDIKSESKRVTSGDPKQYSNRESNNKTNTQNRPAK